MQIQEEVKRTFVADDGTEFSTEKECHEYEMIEAHKEIGKSQKYIIGHLYNDGSAYMRKYKRKEYKNGKVAHYDMGGTGNVKYAYKFDSFEEAYNVGGNRVLTLESAQKATEIYIEKQAHKKVRAQRYVCEYDNDPTEFDDYITNLGMLTWTGTDWNAGMENPEFWMRKVNLTER